MFFFPILPKSRAARKAAKQLYPQLVIRSREPVFYTAFDVPDSFTGRFEMVSLHTGLLINRLRLENHDGQRLAQALFDEMVLNMDMACRQSGIGDLGVPKQIKKMMIGLQGRAITYDSAIESGNLNNALAKNLYATVKRPPENILAAMGGYVIACDRIFAAQPLKDLREGRVNLPPLPSVRDTGETNAQVSQVA